MRTVIKWHLHLPSFYWICIACLLLPIYSSANNSTKENLSNKKAIELSEILLQDSTQVTGHIVDKLGEPLIGVTVLNENTKRGSMTDLDGNYKIIAKTGDKLVFRYIGMKTVKITLRQGQSNINMTLEDDENVLEDVVVTGYQTISKERATGSYAILTSKSLENKTDVNLMSRIEGLVAGINNSGETRYNDIIIRGRSTIEGSKGVLYVVDGIPYEGNTDAYIDDATRNPLKNINPNDVANITVLKDAAATSIYGARAANGVIVITTHRGRAGKTKVSYNGTVRFSEAPSLSSLNLTNSSELVDYFQTVYNTVTPNGYSFKNTYNTSWDERKFRDPVYDALVAHDNSSIDKNELDKRLAYYSSLNNRNQIYDEFSRTAITHQHTLSVSGGSDIYKFHISGNFINNDEHDKYSSSKQYAINSKNDFNISPKLSAHLNLTTNINSSNQSNYNTDSYASLFQKYPSYYMLKDENGNLLNLPNGRGGVYKSNFELDRLIGLGLYNEYYYPTQDMNSNLYSTKSNYIRIQGGVNWKIIDGLSANAIYQTEIVNSKKKEHFLEESYYMRSNINDAAQVDQGVITYNVPIGGRLNERRSDQQSNTIRGQLNFNKTFKKDHTITALGGIELRENNSTSGEKILLGYDENGMRYALPDPKLGITIYPTEALNNYYTDNSVFSFKINDNQNRFVSFYGNASYSYRQRYDISASARLDESNLFGRKAENKWNPIWSTGALWHIAKEDFMKDIDWINYLKLRLTYGLGGNFPSGSAGIYARVVSANKDSYTNLYPLAYIRDPKNEKLTWETTSTTNIGLDFSFFNSRLSGNFDYYQKRSTELLGDKAADPTLGWSLIKINYGDMENRGVEVSLNGSIIKTRDFSWNTLLTYTYNKNKVVKFKVAQTRNDFLYNDVLQLDKPLSSVYSTRYAGLDDKGEPLFYNQENEKVAFKDLTKDDLVFSGTKMPKYTSALMNSFSYKNLELSFKFIYYGGHVIRDQSLQSLTGEETVNFNKESLNFWKKPGDELNSNNEPNLNLAPALNPTTRKDWILGWLSRDTNIKQAHYIKLRNVNLAYRVPKSILNKINIEQLTLSFQADNLAWWASNGNIDPETSSNNNEYYYIAMRAKPTYSFGLNINF